MDLTLVWQWTIIFRWFYCILAALFFCRTPFFPRIFFFSFFTSIRKAHNMKQGRQAKMYTLYICIKREKNAFPFPFFFFFETVQHTRNPHCFPACNDGLNNVSCIYKGNLKINVRSEGRGVSFFFFWNEEKVWWISLFFILLIYYKKNLKNNKKLGFWRTLILNYFW